MTTKADLYRLIDELPEDELDRVREQLEQLVDVEHELAAFAARHGLSLAEVRADPVLRSLATAPLDDEPETEEERAAVAEARAELARGEGIPDEELDRVLGQ